MGVGVGGCVFLCEKVCACVCVYVCVCVCVCVCVFDILWPSHGIRDSLFCASCTDTNADSNTHTHRKKTQTDSQIDRKID